MTNKTRTYPYTAWRLMPSFKPVQVTLIARHRYDSDYDTDDNETNRHISNLFASKAAAIAEGRARVEKQAANLAKSLATLDKKRAALQKAEAA